ncbi:hypothetical protein ACFSFZ_12925 [Mixta tenebrionis]|uniref:Uncharacterized protein n=1 Tax=Mixta tenebrionis TaxID=2562439 RepID=A0A506VFX0_9GAMM|nr:hypothetical protein [Mixta tenebrionis]TPW44488.1 hypothetical protein FKM52_01905 [Mixta tenebrionis]
MLRAAPLCLSLLLVSPGLLADCLSGAEMTLFGQVSYAKRQPALWRPDGKHPYQKDNFYNDWGLHYSNRCWLVENSLETQVSLYALAYQPYRKPKSFEQDRHRVRGLIDRLSLSWTLSEQLSVAAGKLRARPGLFYLKSPANLLAGYYGGFKASGIHHLELKPIYSEAFWGLRLTEETPDYVLAFTLSPRLTHIAKRYESSGNWTAAERANASERYLLRYTDYRAANHTPSLSIGLGESRSIAVADSFYLTPQFAINAELAWHSRQQWRHLDSDKARQVQDYQFPASLYHRSSRNGVEAAFGSHYTTDNFSLLGVEYYFQSEGYSRTAWRQQTQLIRFLNQRSGYAPLDRAFDAWQYLMGAEIDNVANRGQLQGRHYLHAFATLRLADRASLQPYGVINLQDNSLAFGIHYNKPLVQLDGKMELYSGIYRAQGNKDSEFGLFGNTTGVYSGIKYYF